MKNNRVRLATTHLNWAGFTGVVWYVAIFTIVYLGIFLIFGAIELDDLAYTAMGLNANRVFMLVMGIIVGGAYLSWAFSLSITRKQFYKANLLSGAIISVVLVGAILLIGLLVNLLPFSGTDSYTDTMQMHPVLNIITLLLQTYLAYLAGTLIGMGFYRNSWAGTLAILIAVVFNASADMMDPYIVDFLNASAGTGILIITILYLIILALLNYIYTRDVAIRV